MTKKKESINNEEVIELGEKEKLTEILSECYEVAEVECKKENIDDLIVDIGEEDSKVIIELANTKHACRGAALTLAIYKILHPEQDIRSHKAEYENGFSARGVDHSVTVPFLIQKGLPYNVDTHWLSQTLSYSQPYMPDVVLKTVPKKVGPDFIITVNLIQNSVSTERVKKITILILEKMIEERNKGNIPLTKPKNLSIDQVMEILHKQFSVNYEKNAPRLPQIAVYDSEISGEIYSLEKLLASYDAFSSEKEEFLQKIKDHIDVIRGKKASWYGLNLYEIEECVHLHEFCLISGEGGIGKSYFIKCFEERLETKNIPHLCLYGKFEKDIYNLDIEEIINDCKSGFVFIVDAVNEMSEKGQEDLFQVLVDIKKHSKVRIVITYRNNAMDADILKQYREIASAEYAFPGVSFESALGEILKLSVPDVYKYEDILYSNNALLLSMLCNVLSSTKLTDETENGIASITFILEQYIKKSIGKIFKGSISCQGVDIWKDTKRIAQWMYEHEEKRIDEFNLLSIVKTGTDYLTTMIQLGFLGYYESESIRYFYFLIDSLTDFLVARSLFDDIRGKIFDEQVDIIKSKIRNLYNLEEAVIIAIFDNLSPNYEYIKKLLVSTGLMERLQYDTLVKIKFKKDSIQDFLTVFSPAKPDELLGVMGGYTDKPFNCTNYLRNYYFENECKQTELSVILSGHHFLGGIKGRLKNILYFITLNNRSDRRDDEAYYFAILCCSAPNKDVRCLAMKLLYEIVSSRTVFKKRLIEEYKIFTDFYIKEAIIFVLSKVKYNDVDIVKFFEKLIKEERNLSAKSIKRIAEYFGDEYGYIRWNRENLYDFKQDAIISDFMDDLLLTVDLMNKEFLPFRYWGKDHIDMHTKFLKNDKHIIGDINNYLEQKYQCVRTGDCNGSVAFERRIMAEISPKADIETLDMNSFFESYEVIIKKLFNHYQVTNKKTERHMREEDFHDSVYMKCVDIATGLYYGSLMCNYYTNQFATYNNNQNKKRNHVG